MIPDSNRLTIVILFPVYISETWVDFVVERGHVVGGRTKEGEEGGGDEWARDAVWRLKYIRWLARFRRRSGGGRSRVRKRERKTTRASRPDLRFSESLLLFLEGIERAC